MSKSSIDQIVDRVRAARIAWLNERPKISDPTDSAEYVQSLRALWSYHSEAKSRLENIARLVAGMISDCEVEMHEAQRDAEQFAIDEKESET